MKEISRIGLAVAFAGFLVSADAQELIDISNYREYSATFASAGQPSPEQFLLVQSAGFERVVYIAFSTDGTAFANEDKVVKDLGMDYVHVPVVWAHPTAADFGVFASVMQQDPDKKTFLHCQVNFRASAFSLLYRVIYEGVPVAQAKADMNSVWQPNEIWRNFIFEVLAANDISPECDGCDWEIE
jgi:protein tyrosine phosphatase (PTP) superfamily phosphohydrolase (DUF442 family)